MLRLLAKYIAMGGAHGKFTAKWMSGRGDKLIEGVHVSYKGDDALRTWLMIDSNEQDNARRTFPNKDFDQLVHSWANSRLSAIFSPVAYRPQPKSEAELVTRLVQDAEAFGNVHLAERIQARATERAVLRVKNIFDASIGNKL